jgi:hypothetical protein
MLKKLGAMLRGGESEKSAGDGNRKTAAGKGGEEEQPSRAKDDEEVAKVVPRANTIQRPEALQDEEAQPLGPSGRRALARCFGLHARAPWVIPAPFAIWIRPVREESGGGEERVPSGWLGEPRQNGWYQPTRRFWIDHCREGHAPDGRGCDLDYHINMFTPNVNQVLEWGFLMENGQVRVAGPEDFEEECAYFKVIEPAEAKEDTENWVLRTVVIVVVSVLLFLVIFGLFFWGLYHYATYTVPVEEQLTRYDDQLRLLEQKKQLLKQTAGVVGD